MSRIGFVLLTVFVLVVFGVYLLGMSGPLFYDDYSNLEGLARIDSWGAAKEFLVSGSAGPTGRPLALLSFLPHAESWPSARGMLVVNISIHFVNAALLLLFSIKLLSIYFSERSPRYIWCAFGAVSLWLVLPLLASTSLIAVQRMTSLSATFGLLGLLGFLYGYGWQARWPVWGVVCQLAALGAGTLCALFTKENGALIPIYALVVHGLLVPESVRWGGQARYKWSLYLREASLWGALAAILVYLSPLVTSWTEVSPVKGFTGWDRLQAEFAILWQYIRAALLPLPSLFGPFHDDVTVNFAWYIKALAFAAWVGVFALAFWLRRRYIFPWLLFALCWFWAGHLIESTVITLEPYFEHRNYLAVFGFCLLFCLSIEGLKEGGRRLGKALFGVYLLFQLFVLFAVTSVWGDSKKFAELWAHEHPGSGRAALHAVFTATGEAVSQVANANVGYIQSERWAFAREMLNRTIQECSTCLGVRFQSVVYSCLLKDKESIDRTRNSILNTSNGTGVRSAVASLFTIRELIKVNRCHLSKADALQLVDHLLDQPAIQQPLLESRLLFVGAMLAEDSGLNDLRDRYLGAAEQAAPNILPVLQYQVHVALADGRPDMALDALKRREQFIQDYTIDENDQFSNLKALVEKGD